MTPSTIADLEALGYTLGIAQGSVAVEEAALAVAESDAAPAVVIEQADTVTRETVAGLVAAGKLPETPEEKLELVNSIAAAALDQLTDRATSRVEFHRRALAIAREMPDVWRIEQRSPETGALVVSVLVAATDDGVGVDETQQQIIDALADPDGYAERGWLGDQPEALELVARAAACRVVVTRPQPGADVFEAEGRTFTLAELEEFVSGDVEQRPKPASTAERVAGVLSSAPELSDATRSALLEALAEPPAS